MGGLSKKAATLIAATDSNKKAPSMTGLYGLNCLPIAIINVRHRMDSPTSKAFFIMVSMSRELV